jgi:hypothetical protein
MAAVVLKVPKGKSRIVLAQNVAALLRALDEARTERRWRRRE